MISYGVRNAIIDADGPNARTYATRTTVYVAASGKDNYLGNTPSRPLLTTLRAEQILQSITSAGGSATIIGVNETVLSVLDSFEFIPADINFSNFYFNLQNGVPIPTV